MREKVNTYEIDKPLIFKTVKRITESLNRRFEKNADLYVSNQDIHKIKNALRNSNIKLITKWFEQKKHSADILSKVILRNAWLMKPLDRNKLRPLMPIFRRCEATLFIEIMEEVLSGQIDVPENFRAMLERLFYERVSIEKCQEVLEAGHRNLSLLAICFRRSINHTSSSEQLYKEAKQHFISYPNLQNKINSLSITHLEATQQEQLAQIIFENEILPVERPHWFWRNTFSNLGRISFDKCCGYLIKTRLRRDPNQRKMVRMIARIMNRHRNQHDADYFVQNMINLYHHNPNIRYGLILFGARAIRDLELAQHVVKEFQKIRIPKIQVLENTVRDILAGKTDDIKIESVEDLMDQIAADLTDGRRRFLIAIFRRSKQFEAMFKQLLADHGHESVVQDFIAELLKNEHNPHFLHITLSYWTQEKDDHFKDKLIEVITARQLRTPSVRRFLFNYDFDLFKVIFGTT